MWYPQVVLRIKAVAIVITQVHFVNQVLDKKRPLPEVFSVLIIQTFIEVNMVYSRCFKII